MKDSKQKADELVKAVDDLIQERVVQALAAYTVAFMEEAGEPVPEDIASEVTNKKVNAAKRHFRAKLDELYEQVETTGKVANGIMYGKLG